MASGRGIPTATAVGAATEDPLTARETAILTLLTEPLSNGELADRLFVSVNTVKSHLKSIYRKLDVSSRSNAVARAHDLGLL